MGQRGVNDKGLRRNRTLSPRCPLPIEYRCAPSENPGRLDINGAFDEQAFVSVAAVVNTTVVAGENLTVGSTVWLPAESVAPGR